MPGQTSAASGIRPTRSTAKGIVAGCSGPVARATYDDQMPRFGGAFLMGKRARYERGEPTRKSPGSCQGSRTRWGARGCARGRCRYMGPQLRRSSGGRGLVGSQAPTEATPVGQRRGRSIPESHPPVSDRLRPLNPDKDGDLRTDTQRSSRARQGLSGPRRAGGLV
jgi:hypothetical protein